MRAQAGLFRENESASQEVIGFILNSFEDGFGVFLPPAGTTPQTLAAVLLHFLVTLPEPLLTFKCVLTWPRPHAAARLDTATSSCNVAACPVMCRYAAQSSTSDEV